MPVSKVPTPQGDAREIGATPSRAVSEAKVTDSSAGKSTPAKKVVAKAASAKNGDTSAAQRPAAKATAAKEASKAAAPPAAAEGFPTKVLSTEDPTGQDGGASASQGEWQTRGRLRRERT